MDINMKQKNSPSPSTKSTTGQHWRVECDHNIAALFVKARTLPNIPDYSMHRIVWGVCKDRECQGILKVKSCFLKAQTAMESASSQEHPPHGFHIPSSCWRNRRRKLNGISDSGNSCNKKRPRAEQCPTWQGNQNPAPALWKWENSLQIKPGSQSVHPCRSWASPTQHRCVSNSCLESRILLNIPANSTGAERAEPENWHTSPSPRINWDTTALTSLMKLQLGSN